MRIVCLSAEAADICFGLGAEADVVAVSAFAPKQPQKPVVSGFSHGNIENIVQANPELVITFSDVQARLADNLIRAGIPVLALKSFYGCRGGRRDSAVGPHPRAGRSGRKPGQHIPGGSTESHLLSGGASPSLFRRMERPNDYWHPLDFGNHSNSGRRRYICWAILAESRATSGLGRENCVGKPPDYPSQLVWEGGRCRLDPESRRFFLH